MEGTAMTEFLSQMTEFSTWSFSQLGNAWNFIVGNPMLMVGIGMTVIGFIVGLWHRFARQSRLDWLYPLSLSPLYGGGLLKRIRFFLKKYISVLVVIVLLITTVFSFSVFAEGQPIDYTDLDIDSLTFVVLPEDPYTIQNPPQHSSGFLLWNPQLPSYYQPFNMSSNSSFTEILTLNSPSGLSEGNYKLSLRPVFYFNSSISDSVGSARITITLGLSEKVVVQTTVPGKKVSGYGNPNNVRFDIDLDISYDPSIHQQLFNYMVINYHFIGSSVSGSLGFVGFNVAPRIIAPEALPSFGSSDIDNIENQESDILDRFSNDANGVLDSLENTVGGFLSQNQQSLFAFRRISDNFFEKPWVLNILSVAIIVGVLPFLARIVIRRH